MSSIMTQLSIGLRENPQEMTKENFLNFLAWSRNKSALGDYVLTPFKESALSVVGYSDNKRPSEKEVKTPVKAGDIEMLVTTKLTTKRPSWKKVVDSFGGYLVGLLEGQYERDIRRKGVITVNDEPYVAVDDLVQKMGEDIGQLLDGKEGISQSLDLPDGLVVTAPDRITVVFNRDYGALTEYNARMYAEVDAFIRKGNAYEKMFKEALMADSMRTMGVADIKEVGAVSYPFGDLEFVHQIEPRGSPKYEAVVECFLKEPPEKISKRTRIGDLVLAPMSINGDADVLKEKGLLTPDFIASYRPIRREDTVLVRLRGVQERLAYHAQNTTKQTVEQNVYMLPV